MILFHLFWISLLIFEMKTLNVCWALPKEGKNYLLETYFSPCKIMVLLLGEMTHILLFTGDKQNSVAISLSVHPAPGAGVQERIVFEPSQENRELPTRIRRYQTKAINRGLASALTRGWFMFSTQKQWLMFKVFLIFFW